MSADMIGLVLDKLIGIAIGVWGYFYGRSLSKHPDPKWASKAGFVRTCGIVVIAASTLLLIIKIAKPH